MAIDSIASQGFVPEIFLGTALGRLRNYLTLSRTVTMNTDLETGETFEVGKILHLPKRGTLTVNQKTETGNVTVQSPTSSTVDVVLTQHPEVTFALTSEAIAFQNQDQAQGYVNDAIIALAENIDNSLFQVWKLIPSAQIVTNASTITEANILTARQYLRTNQVQPNAKMYGAIALNQEAAAFQLANLVRFDAIGVTNNVSNAEIGDGQITMPGAIGRAYGFEICPSQLVPSVAANDNSLQTVTLGASNTGGTFTLTANSITTNALPYNATAAQVQIALYQAYGLQYSNGGPFVQGQVFVTGSAGGPYTVAQIVPNGATLYAITGTGALTGGTNTVTCAQVAQTTGSKNLFYTQDSRLPAPARSARS